MSLVATSLLAPPPHVRQHCRCSRLRFSCCRRSKRHVPHRFRFSSDSRIDDILHSLNTYYSLITWSWEPWAKQRSMGDIDICFVSRYLIYKTLNPNFSVSGPYPFIVRLLCILMVMNLIYHKLNTRGIVNENSMIRNNMNWNNVRVPSDSERKIAVTIQDSSILVLPWFFLSFTLHLRLVLQRT